MVADRLLGWGLGRLIYSSRSRFALIYGAQLSHDVWIAGNSRGVNGVLAPDLAARLGRPVANLAYNGLPMTVVEALLADALRLNLPPKVVVIEVNCLVTDEAVLSDLKVFATPGSSLFALLEKRRPDITTQMRWFNSWRFNSEVTLRTLHGIVRSDQSWMNGRVIPRGLGENYRPAGGEDDGFVIREENWAALNRIITRLHERGARVVLYSAPYIKGFPVHERNFSALIARSRTLVGDKVRLLDLSQAVEDWRCFADPVHSNPEGWARIRENVADAIQQVSSARTAAGASAMRNSFPEVTPSQRLERP